MLLWAEFQRWRPATNANGRGCLAAKLGPILGTAGEAAVEGSVLSGTPA